MAVYFSKNNWLRPINENAFMGVWGWNVTNLGQDCLDRGFLIYCFNTEENGRFMAERTRKIVPNNKDRNTSCVEPGIGGWLFCKVLSGQAGFLGLMWK